MYQFLVENSIYVVLFIVLIIWTGISIALFTVEKKVSNLEKKLDEIYKVNGER